MKVQEPFLKQDLARRDALPRDIAAVETHGELQRETVLLIHGTFANKAASTPAWWQPDSDFCRKLDASLSQRGSQARCWTHIGNGKNVFAWTGDNLESERRIGGDGLVKEIADLEARRDISRYHIVAHSHGGNVVLHALRSLAVDPKNLGAVIFLGTPVLRFSHLPPWLNRRAVAMFFYGAGLVGSITLPLLASEYRDILWIPGPIAFGLLLLDEWWRKPQRQPPIYGAGHAHAFEFADDEAMKALRLSLEFAQRPRDVLKRLFSTKAPLNYAVDPPERPKFWKAIWSKEKENSAYRFLETWMSRQPVKSKNAVQIVFSNVVGLLALFTGLTGLVLLVKSILAGKGFLGWVLRFVDLGHEPVFLPYSVALNVITFSLLTFVAVATLTLITMIIWSLLTTVFKFIKLGVARAGRKFLEGPGVRIMGKVVRNAAFGGQCKKVLSPPLLPDDERAWSETISGELNQKMSDLFRETAAQAGEAFYSALREGDAMQLEDHVLAQLTDPKLAHCQYYCEDEIMNRIAELIAAPVSIREL